MCPTCSAHEFIQCLHWPFCPGVFIAFLAVVAAAVTFRKDPSRGEKIAWIGVFFFLMCGEIWMMGKDRDKRDLEEAAAQAATQQQTVTNALLLGQITTANGHISDLDMKIDSVKGDPKLFMALQAQLNDARTQRDMATRQLLVANAGNKKVLLATLEGTVQEVLGRAREWYAADELLRDQIKKLSDLSRQADANSASKIKYGQEISLLMQRLSYQDAAYSGQVKPVMENANYLREQLIQGEPETEDDHRVAVIFVDWARGELIYPSELETVAHYLESLNGRLESPSEATKR